MMRQRFEKIVKHYLSRYRRCGKAELSPFRKYTFKTAIAKAGMAEMEDGRRFDHQWRIPGAVLLKSKTALLRAKKSVLSASTFEDLHATVETVIGSIVGIGKLTIYDTALRIGANLGLEPKGIYLHSGTLKGAKNLGLYNRKAVLSKSEIPTPLRKLKPLEIEDVLCIYKDCFTCTKRQCPLPGQRCGEEKIRCSGGSSSGGCSNLRVIRPL